MSSVACKRRKNLVVAWMLIIVTVISVFAGAITAFAHVNGGNPYDTLVLRCKTADFPDNMNTDKKKITEKKYKQTGGSYLLYTEITGIDSGSSDVLVETQYEKLTAGAKRDFLRDYISVAYAWEEWYKANPKSSNPQTLITNETVTDLFKELQQVSGAGSQLMAAVMNDVKPDYASANRILKPFSSPASVILGVLAILAIIGVGLTIALDIVYITVPGFQLMVDGGDDNGQGKKGLSKIISVEARSAVQSADGGGGAGGQSGNNREAITEYFKKRWKGLLMLGICLLYLVGGHLWSLVAWVIDLVSGFLGF